MKVSSPSYWSSWSQFSSNRNKKCSKSRWLPSRWMEWKVPNMARTISFLSSSNRWRCTSSSLWCPRTTGSTLMTTTTWKMSPRSSLTFTSTDHRQRLTYPTRKATTRQSKYTITMLTYLTTRWRLNLFSRCLSARPSNRHELKLSRRMKTQF